MALKFPPRPSPPRPKKRCRAVADIDGEHSTLHKKKRRLRLFLITSRLSPEFSSPATNIVDRGSSKIAVWAKQKALGRNLLRKAAILNRIRRCSIAARETGEGPGRSFIEQEKEQKQLALAKLAFVYGSHDTHTRPVFKRTPSSPPTSAVRVGGHFEVAGDASSRSSSPDASSPSSSDGGDAREPTYQSPNDAYAYSYDTTQTLRRPRLPLPPSPLGLSNYDAFDQEDDIADPYAHLDDDDQSEERIEDVGHSGPRSPLANTSASYTATLSTAPTGTNEVLKTPPQMIYSDFNILDPGEPVLGDYDQVDEGANAIWPNGLASEPLHPPSEYGSQQQNACSPNFSALFATSSETPATQASLGSTAFTGVLTRKDEDIQRERERQRRLMFLQLNS